MKSGDVRRVALLVCFVAALTFVVGGCGSDPNGSPAGPSGTTQGVTIQGTINAGTALSSQVSSQSATPGSGMKVTVVGTNLSTTSNGRGEFVITGAPGGTVVLHFEGRGIDARLELSGLVEGQTIRIKVQVSGNNAKRQDDDETEIRGLVEAILSPTSIRVAGVTVTVDSATEIRKDNGRLLLSEVRVGDTVRVEGVLQADGSILAREIRLEGKNGGVGPEVELEGPISSIAAPNLVVDGRTVRTDSRTKFHGDGIKSLADLGVGDRVEVEGRLQSDNTIHAEEVKKD